MSRPDDVVKLVKINCSKQLDEIFKLGQKLGEGAFGSVLLAERLNDGEKFAVKKVAKQKDTRSTYGKSYENEIMVLRRFKHQNLVRLEVIYESDNNCYLFLEFCDAGTLSDELKRRGKFNEPDSRCVSRQLGNAMSFLHRKNIVHRDLKLQNCLLKHCGRAASAIHHNQQQQQQQNNHHQLSVQSTNPSCSNSSSRSNSSNSISTASCPFIVKLSDFGLSIELRGEDKALLDNVGTPAYQAPEIVTGVRYTCKCDMWSFGVAVYWLLHGESPYQSLCRSELDLQTVIPSYDFDQHSAECELCQSAVSSQCRRALTHLLMTDPLNRWSASEFVQSAWITENLQSDCEDSGSILTLMRNINKQKHQ